MQLLSCFDFRAGLVFVRAVVTSSSRRLSYTNTPSGPALGEGQQVRPPGAHGARGPRHGHSGNSRKSGQVIRVIKILGN